MMATLTFIFVVVCVSQVNSQSPDFVAEIFRHGIRSPQPAKYDESWKTNGGYSELTDVGIRQQYTLGAVLGNTYSSLLKPFTMSSLYVLSTSDNRTISSALTQLYGIYNGAGPDMPGGYDVTLAYPPYNDPSVATTATAIGTPAAANKFTPIPVHTVEKKDDYLLESYLNCKNANPWFNSMNTDSTVTDLYDSMSTTVANLRNLGLTIENFSDFNDLGDTVIADQANGKALPGGISPASQEFKDLAFYTQWYNIYASLSLPKQRQLFSGPFLYNILNYIHLLQEDKKVPKFAFFAAKESMLATLLGAFDIMTPQCLRANWEAEKNGQTPPHPLCKYPVYASSIIFEFYKTPTPKVIVKYNGNALALCNGNTECTLAEFEDLVDTVTDNTDLGAFHTKCGNNPTTPTPTTTTVTVTDDGLRAVDWVLIGLCIAFFMVSVGFAVVLYVVKSRVKLASIRPNPELTESKETLREMKETV